MKGMRLQCVMLSVVMMLVFSIGCVAQTPREYGRWVKERVG